MQVDNDILERLLKSLKSDILEKIISFVYVSNLEGVIYNYNALAKDIFKDRMVVGNKFDLQNDRTDIVKMSFVHDGDNTYFEMYYDKKWFKVMKTKAKLMDEEYVLVSGVEITDMKMLTVSLMVDATTDSMTGILNRAAGIEYLERYTYELRRGSNGFTICYLDLNNLKMINDNYGHNYGDEYIITVINIIKEAIRITDVFCRMGGDEFLIIFPKCEKYKVENVMKAVCEKLDTVTNELKYKYAISYGILQIEQDSNLIIEDILKEVDIEMYKMKKRYKDNKLEKTSTM